MPKSKPLAQPANIVYLYDGSLPGFFCCVHESVYFQEIPYAIYPADKAEPSLLPQKTIATDMTKARKVRASIPSKINKRALELIERVFLSCLKDKEAAMLNFLLFAYRQGGSATRMLGHPLVTPLLEGEKHLMGEVHLLLGFVRFADYDGVLAGTITPKNFVLPFIANHFTSRYSQEDFMLYDKTHQAALIYQGGKKSIVQLENVVFPEVSETEAKYRGLWKNFYDTIAIEARYNPRCRMSHMPKRYWENMPEMQDQY